MGAREAVKMASWIKPKSEHRKMVSRLLQVRAHLILCFRAAEKIEMVRGQDGKTEVRKKVTATGLDGWVPIAEKSLPYELTASFLLMASRPGYPLPIKLQEQHKALFPLDKPIDEKSGELIAAWAKGGNLTREPDREPAQAGRYDLAGHALQRTGESGAPVARESTGTPEDDRAGYIAIVESATPARIMLQKKKLFGDPAIDHRNMELSSLKTLADSLSPRP